MIKSEVVRIFMTILGYPIGRTCKLINLYCVMMVTTVTGVYLYVRFLRKYFVTIKSVNVYDKFQVVGMVSSPAVLVAMATNCYHLFTLIVRHKVYSRMFRNGRVLGVLGRFDIIFMLLSTFVFIPHLMRKNLTLIDKLRFVMFGPVVNLHFFIAFQFCAILRYHAAKIFNLAEMMRAHFLGPKIHPRKLAFWCIEQRKFVASEVLESLEEFSIKMFVVICFIVIDLIQFLTYYISRIVEEELPPLLKFSYSYMLLIRCLMATYINWHFQEIKKQVGV